MPPRSCLQWPHLSCLSLLQSRRAVHGYNIFFPASAYNLGEMAGAFPQEQSTVATPPLQPDSLEQHHIDGTSAKAGCIREGLSNLIHGTDAGERGWKKPPIAEQEILQSLKFHQSLMWKSLCSEKLCPLRNPVLAVALCPIFPLSALRNRKDIHPSQNSSLHNLDPPISFMRFFCLMWLSLEEAKRMQRRREGDGLRVLSSWVQMGVPSAVSHVSGFPSIGTLFHFRAVWFPGPCVSGCFPTGIPFPPQNCMVSGLLSPRIPIHLGRIHFLIQLLSLILRFTH